MQEYTDLRGLIDYSGIPKPTLRDYIKRDGLPCFKLRGKIVVKLSEFDQWIEKYRLDTGQDFQRIVDDALHAVASDS